MANPVIGTCVCPLCSEPGAEVREGAKGRLYIVCEGCVSNVYTMSRQGRALIANRLKPAPDQTKVGADDAATVASPAPTPKPAAKPAPVKMGIFGL